MDKMFQIHTDNVEGKNAHWTITNKQEEVDKVSHVLYEAVPLNNSAVKLSAEGRYEEAIVLFQRAIDMKKEVFGEESVEVCISLSGLADAHLSLGRLEDAYREAIRMRDICKKIRSKSQLKIAMEILADIAKAQVAAGTKSSSKAAPTENENIAIMDIHQCNSVGCGKKDDLKLCGKCKKVAYCSIQCQKVKDYDFTKLIIQLT